MSINDPVRRIAILGAGHVGPAFGRLAVAAGYDVAIAASGDPEQIALITDILVPGARAAWARDAVASADLVLLALPMHRFPELDPRLVAGKVVVDALNYWPPVDGVIPLFEDDPRGSSEVVAERLAGSVVVKSLNHMGYHEVEEQARTLGSQGRLALGVAGDVPDAVRAVATFVDRIGYDPVELGALTTGRLLQPGGPVFGATLTRSEFEARLLAAPIGSSD